jgi:serine/threonine protein kinase
MMRELCTTAHPNIVEVRDSGKFPSSPHVYIDMELCEMNLEEYIKVVWTAARCEMEWPVDFMAKQLWTIMNQITSGLEFIHRHNKVHRDLKPANGLFLQRILLILIVLYSSRPTTASDLVSRDDKIGSGSGRSGWKRLAESN